VSGTSFGQNYMRRDIDTSSQVMTVSSQVINSSMQSQVETPFCQDIVLRDADTNRTEEIVEEYSDSSEDSEYVPHNDDSGEESEVVDLRKKAK
jgi:hypothetical protein